MNNILIMAHAPLASALRSAVLHVFPLAAGRVRAMDVQASHTQEQTLAQAAALLGQAKEGDTDTLIVSDVMGATPCNVAQKLVDGVRVRCVTGASLPMLLRAITYGDEPLAQMLSKAIAGSVQGAVEVL